MLERFSFLLPFELLFLFLVDRLFLFSLYLLLELPLTVLLVRFEVRFPLWSWLLSPFELLLLYSLGHLFFVLPESELIVAHLARVFLGLQWLG